MPGPGCRFSQDALALLAEDHRVSGDGADLRWVSRVQASLQVHYTYVLVVGGRCGCGGRGAGSRGYNDVTAGGVGTFIRLAWTVPLLGVGVVVEGVVAGSAVEVIASR